MVVALRGNRHGLFGPVNDDDSFIGRDAGADPCNRYARAAAQFCHAGAITVSGAKQQLIVFAAA
jgi:hypothetical protein